jgi:ribonuclease HII
MSMRGVVNIAGVDEAGRGPLAGAVFAAAVILDQNSVIKGLDDSKKLSPAKRSSLECEIKDRALSWSVAIATVEEIDRLNILQASLLAMKRAVEGLDIKPNFALIDGNKIPDLSCPANAVIGGDAIHGEISAASILAKEARDREMIELGIQLPEYGFERHKGYPTKAHLQALQLHGVTDQHRRSFSPVRKLLDKN